MRNAFAAAIALGAAALQCAAPAAAQTQLAVEYHHAAWNHYFVTAFPEEVSFLDGGGLGGAWKRTGQSFDVRSQPGPGAAATCRFFSLAFAPRSSHFYTPLDSECAAVKSNPNWQFEAIAFYLAQPDAAGACPAGTRTLYRLYNDGKSGAPNHRYTVDATVFNDMRAAGWIAEGNGATLAFACVPATAAGGSAEGMWVGTTSLGESVRGFVLGDGSFWLIHTPKGALEPTGVWQGTSTTAGGDFRSADARDFPVASTGETGTGYSPMSIGGTYLSRQSLSLTIVGDDGMRTLQATYDAAYEAGPTVGAVAGSFSGYSGHGDGGVNAGFGVSGDGTLSGSNPICTFKGSIAPRASGNVFDFSLHGTSSGCIMGTVTTIVGIAHYDAAAGRFFGILPFANRTDSYHLVGSKR